MNSTDLQTEFMFKLYPPTSKARPIVMPAIALY